MQDLMYQYDQALETILRDGVSRTSKRTKQKTLSIFGMLSRYRLDKENFFPILTRRKISPKAVFAELLWFLSGSTNNEDLRKLGCNFWTPWVDPDFEQKHGYAPGAFGPVYGFQLRHFGGEYGNGIGGLVRSKDAFITQFVPSEPPYEGGTMEQSSVYGLDGFDQLTHVIERIKDDPSDRRTLWTLWNPQDVSDMRLPPCHMLYQVMVDDDRNLTGMLYQRSCDFPIGVPANIQFYSALTVMLAQQTDCKAHELVHVTADSHIYADQIKAVEKYLALPKIESPKLEIRKANSIEEYTMDSFVLTDFNQGPKLEIPVAV